MWLRVLSRDLSCHSVPRDSDVLLPTVNWKLRLTIIAAATTQADGVQLCRWELPSKIVVLTSVDFRLRKEEEGTWTGNSSLRSSCGLVWEVGETEGCHFAQALGMMSIHLLYPISFPYAAPSWSNSASPSSQHSYLIRRPLPDRIRRVDEDVASILTIKLLVETLAHVVAASCIAYWVCQFHYALSYSKR